MIFLEIAALRAPICCNWRFLRLHSTLASHAGQSSSTWSAKDTRSVTGGASIGTDLQISSNILKWFQIVFLGREKSWLQIASSRVCRGVRKSWGSTITEGGWLNLWVRSFIHLSSFGRVLSTRPRLSRLSPAPRRKPRKQLPKKQKRRLSRLGLYWQHFDVWFVSVGGTCLKEWMEFSWNLQ